jgi:hypothetical protein
MREDWKIEELTATALRNSSGGTMSEISACRVGLSTTQIRPGDDREQEDLPRLRGARQHDQCGAAGDRAIERLRGHQQRLAGYAIGEGAAERPEHKRGQELECRGEPDRLRAVGQGQDEPVLRDVLHPGPEAHERLGDGIDAKGPYPQRAERGSADEGAGTPS